MKACEIADSSQLSSLQDFHELSLHLVPYWVPDTHIYLSYIQKKMDEKGMFGKYTKHELLDELDVVECFIAPVKAPIQVELLIKKNSFA